MMLLGFYLNIYRLPCERGLNGFSFLFETDQCKNMNDSKKKKLELH